MDYSHASIIFTVLGFIGIGITAYHQHAGADLNAWISIFGSVLALVLALIFLIKHQSLEKQENEKEE